MATQMLAQAPAVAAAPRTVGALETAAVPGDPDTDWGKGVIYWPEAAPGWRSVTDCAPGSVDYGLGDGSDPVGTIPFVIQTLTRCPRIALDRLVERAHRQLVAVTSQAMARELWTGDLTRAEPWTLPDGAPFTLANPRPAGATGAGPAGPWLNPHLAAAEMLDAAEHPAEAVGAAEAAAAERMAGGPVYLHVPVDWLMPLSQFGVREVGNLIRTPLGSIIVCDAGYRGNTGGDAAVYATGPVTAWVGEPTVLTDPASIVELDTNRIGVWAERPALVTFDPQTLVGCAITH